MQLALPRSGVVENFILIVPPHKVLDETFLALKFEYDILDDS